MLTIVRYKFDGWDLEVEVREMRAFLQEDIPPLDHLTSAFRSEFKKINLIGCQKLVYLSWEPTASYFWHCPKSKQTCPVPTRREALGTPPFGVA